MAVADFNGDGHPDLVWQHDTSRIVNVVYFGGPQGTINLGWKPLWATPLPGWRVAAARDFNRDGTPDLVWQDDATRVVTVVYFGGPQGTVMLGWNWLWGTPLPEWTVVGANDFDGNGTPDLVWQHDTTREATIVYQGGPQGNVMLGWAWLSGTGLSGQHLIVR